MHSPVSGLTPTEHDRINPLESPKLTGGALQTDFRQTRSLEQVRELVVQGTSFETHDKFDWSSETGFELQTNLVSDGGFDLSSFQQTLDSHNALSSGQWNLTDDNASLTTVLCRLTHA